MRNFFIVIFLVFSAQIMFAQTGQISGSISDSVNIRNVAFASISAIRKSDSVLIKYSRSNQQGKFELNDLPFDKYIILIAHSSFVDYVDEVNLTSTNNNVALGTINMLQRGMMLKEVFIKNAANIKVKGDTLEYLADSFKVRQGAMVEDLLKSLPGIQVNKKGEITAMGEKVDKVLVDGEEFFGDDPTVATQNIQSKIVDKVQVFDQKSDQAKFTGFDDGQEQKTINLKLKKDMNRGEFGKIEMSGGWEDRWQNKAMINSFKNKRQLSAYGLMSSNGTTGLGWEERNQFASSGNNNVMDEETGFMFNFDNSNQEDGGNSNWGIPEGITKAWTGGLHYANKWNEGKEHLNTNYSFGRINRTKRETSLTENLFPGRNYMTVDTMESFNSRNTHRMNVQYETNVDSTLSIVYRMNGRLSYLDSKTDRTTENSTFSDIPINSSKNLNTSQSVTTRVSNQITTNKKLKKAGRTLSLMGRHEYNNTSSDGNLSGVNNFSINGSTLSNVLDQAKKTKSIDNTLTGSATYTEPLNSKILMKVSYEIGNTGSNSSRTTLEKLAPEEEDYTFQIDSLSTNFQSNIFNQTGGLEFKWTEKKYNITAGSRVRYSMFDQKDKIRSQDFNYNRWNLFPTLRFNYKFDQSKRLTFSYNGSTRQPSISQLQPVQDNSNPLQLAVGNPDLKISYTQNFNLNYFNYKILSNRSIYSNLSFSNSFNNIVTNRYIDELGRSISKAVNLNGGYNVNFWGGLSSKIRKSPFEGTLNSNISFSHLPNIINNIKGFTNNLEIGLNPSVKYSKEEKYDLELGLGTQFNQSANTLQTSRNISYLSFNPTFNAIAYLPKNFDLSLDLDYQYTPPVGPYTTSFSRMLINSYVSYKMLKNKNLEWRASIFDALNQNKGYERTTANNTNSERNFLTLGRYWLVGFIWNFTSGPMANTQGSKPNGPRATRSPRMRTIRRSH